MIMRWRPLPVALAFAVIGPLVGALLMLALISPSASSFGPFVTDALFDIVFGSYAVGALALGVTGFLVARSAGRGARLSSLTLQGALYALLFTGVSALVWIFAGTEVTSAVGIVAMIAIAGSIGGFAATLIVAGALALLVRVRATG